LSGTHAKNKGHPTARYTIVCNRGSRYSLPALGFSLITFASARQPPLIFVLRRVFLGFLLADLRSAPLAPPTIMPPENPNLDHAIARSKPPAGEAAAPPPPPHTSRTTTALCHRPPLPLSAASSLRLHSNLSHPIGIRVSDMEISNRKGRAVLLLRVRSLNILSVKITIHVEEICSGKQLLGENMESLFKK
jgi:hypothetical protein